MAREIVDSTGKKAPDQGEIRALLEAQAEEKYRIFASRLLPGTSGILGVRLPLLRKMARSLVRQDWRAYLAGARDASFEEIMLQGMVIGYARCDLSERLSHAARFIPKIRNWSICDSFCAGLKAASDAKAEVWAFLQPYMVSREEFEQRFALVMMLDYYLVEDWYPRVLACIDAMPLNGCYAMMAAAWAVSACFVRHPRETLAAIRRIHLDDRTRRMALQKILASTQVDAKTKAVVRALKA